MFISLSQIKEWVKKNQADIILAVGFVLVALIAFGAGRLMAPEIVRNPVVIEDAQNNPTGADIQATTGSSTLSTVSSQISPNQKGIIVVSKNGKKYHWPWCSFAKKIKPENQVWFNSESEAKAAGYSACGSFSRLAPAGYKAQ